MQMVMFVLDNTDHLDAVLDAWREVGVSGVTIIESSGLHRRQKQRPVGARYAFGIPHRAAPVEMAHYTLFAAVPDEAAVRACLEAAEKITGDLDQPDTGVLMAWELSVVKGIPSQLRQKPGGDT